MLRDSATRFFVFAAIFLAMILWEGLVPWRGSGSGRIRRRAANLSLGALGALAVRFLGPVAPAAVADLAAARGWGLFHQRPVPMWAAFALTIALLDLLVYGQHAAFHRVPVLWRLHRVHHTDLALDATTGLRFHTVEIVLSALLKGGVVLLIGAPWSAVVAFEAILNGTSLFNHGNVRIPGAAERVLRWVVVTPDMHRVHHSVEQGETDSNFGFNLPWWDRIFGTYSTAPRAGPDGMTIGLPQFRDATRLGLSALLALPFRRSGQP